MIKDRDSDYIRALYADLVQIGSGGTPALVLSENADGEEKSQVSVVDDVDYARAASALQSFGAFQLTRAVKRGTTACFLGGVLCTSSASQAWYFAEQLPSATYVATLRCVLMAAVGYACLRDMWPPNGVAKFMAFGFLLAVSVLIENSFVILVRAVMRIVDHGGFPFVALFRGLSVALFWPSYGLLGTSTLSTELQLDEKNFIFASGAELLCTHMFLVVPVMIGRIFLQNRGRRALEKIAIQVALTLIAATSFSAGLAVLVNVVVDQDHSLLVNQIIINAICTVVISLEVVLLLRFIK